MTNVSRYAMDELVATYTRKGELGETHAWWAVREWAAENPREVHSHLAALINERNLHPSAAWQQMGFCHYEGFAKIWRPEAIEVFRAAGVHVFTRGRREYVNAYQHDFKKVLLQGRQTNVLEFIEFIGKNTQEVPRLRSVFLKWWSPTTCIGNITLNTTEVKAWMILHKYGWWKETTIQEVDRLWIENQLQYLRQEEVDLADRLLGELASQVF